MKQIYGLSTLLDNRSDTAQFFGYIPGDPRIRRLPGVDQLEGNRALLEQALDERVQLFIRVEVDHQSAATLAAPV